MGGGMLKTSREVSLKNHLRKMCGSLLTILIPQWEYPSYSRSTCGKFVLCSSSCSSSSPPPSSLPPQPPSFYFQLNPVEKTFILETKRRNLGKPKGDHLHVRNSLRCLELSPIPDKRSIFKWFWLKSVLNQFSVGLEHNCCIFTLFSWGLH